MTAASLSLFHPARLIATWFGVGRCPVASGTAGSLAALPFAYLIQLQWGSVVLLSASLALFLVGWIASSICLRYSEDKDPKEIVVDEVAGQWLLISMLYPTIMSYLVAFVLFRLFDILKPWPVSWADKKIGGGLGVMLDDMMAGIYPVVLLILFAVGMKLSGHVIDVNYIAQFLGAPHVQ